MLLTITLFCVAFLLGLSILTVITCRLFNATGLLYGLSFVISIIILTAALSHLLGEKMPETVTLPLGLPWLGAHFRLDALGSFFLAVVNLGAAAASLYALGYGRHEEAPHRVLPFFPAFLAAMNLVVLADDAFSFLVSWEFMSLTSWALVMAHHRVPDNRKAGYTYIVMASFGTLALLLAFGLLAGSEGHYAFSAIREDDYAPWREGLILGFVLLGAGSKAGLVPLHVWLPLAHPAAPSHVSALMSGVMTKVAVYGFIRIVLDLLGGTGNGGSMVVMALGGVSAVMGVLYALMQHDLKRFLAYHTVENIGIIFIGIGLSLAFKANDMDAFAALALTAALFHVFNHSLFKSLLFFGSGAVLNATGERDMDRLGGLIHRMPVTAFFFLIGCVAISALPPLNGFVSEWLTFQAILHGPLLPHWGLKILIPAVGAMLALAAALAAACFVKVFGVVFLGRPRALSAKQAQETDLFSLAAMFVFALLCLLAGILPGFVIDGIAPVTQALTDHHLPLQRGIPWFSMVPISENRSSYDGLLVFMFIITTSVLIAFIIHVMASRDLRRAPAWDCGFPNTDPFTQYTAGSFAAPIRRVFGTYVFRVHEDVDMPPPGDLRPARFKVAVHDLVWEWFYTPLARAVSFAADHLDVIQFLTIRHYLGFVFIFLVSLLLVLALWF